MASEVSQAYFQELRQFLAEERKRHIVYPPEREVQTAFRLTPYERVSVVVLGQDPYPGAGQAHGLAFSVKPGVPPPASLANIFKELASDVDCRIPNNGCLIPWAEQGVLLLNTVLTVRAGQPASHRGRGWERFTDAVIRLVDAKPTPVVFVLWGRDARQKDTLIDRRRHTIVTGVHPSPMSAHNGFFWSRPFSKVNRALRGFGHPEIDWQIADL